MLQLQEEYINNKEAEISSNKTGKYNCLFWPIIEFLTHLCQVDSSTKTLWTGLFPIAECLVSFYYYYVL